MLAKLFKTQSPARIIAFGFAALILLGSVLLIMPFSVKEGINLKYEDALYTSTSAVCITGLITVDTGTTYSAIGQAIICVLMQMGGLGVTAVGAGIILALRKKMNVKGRSLIKEAMNVSSGKSIIKFIKDVFITTAIIEIAGAVLSFFVFIKDFGFFEAVGKSLFHSVAAFNNAGFDNLGDNFNSIAKYSGNAYFNIITALLIIFGGIGFLVIKELLQNRFNFKKLSMHAKVVLTVTAVLLVVGTLLIKLTENVSWLEAFFSSVTARTAGFATISLGNFTVPGMMVIIALMFIGASPGSTGGGVKTSTMFVLFKGISASATNKSEKAFRYSIPKTAFKKAAIIVLLGISIVIFSTYLFLILEPDVTLHEALFEMTSAFATVGLTTGITPSIGLGAKILSIIVMFIGRLGPMTIATLWYFSRGERVRYPEGEITIG